VNIPAEQQTLFHEILDLLEKNKIPLAVAGAFALHQHTGIARDTKDLDLFLTAPNAAVALDCLRAEGFECEICDPVWLHKAHRDQFYVDLITGMSNAALVVEESWIRRALPAVICGVPTRILGAEELIASKLFVTRRERFDGADIAHVLYATRGRLDWQRILHLIGEHWEILFWALVLFHYVYPAHSDYVPRPLWDDLTERFRREIAHPDPAAPFRGSLVDEKMFAIDFREWGMANTLQEYRERRLKQTAQSAAAQTTPRVA
jgi:hypothetical protein